MSQISRWGWVILGALLLGHSAAVLYSAGVHSATWDEGGHLVAGLSHWKFGRFELYSVNPPLVRGVATAPVSVMQPKVDWSAFKDDPKARSEVFLGRRFFDLNGAQSQHYLVVARWACLPFSWLGAGLCFWWARKLYGERAGLLAAGMWCLSPMILGHAALITPDVAAASFALAAMYAFRRFLLEPSWGTAVLLGIVAGLALLTKTTLLALIPLFGVIWLVWRWNVLRERCFQELIHEARLLFVATTVSLVVINGGYAFRGTGIRLGEFEFVSDSLAGPKEARNSTGAGNRFRGSLLASLPVPVPHDFLAGMDLQKRDFEKGAFDRGYQSYLLGEWSQGGWWYYYLVAMAVKEPVGYWILGCLAVAWRIRQRSGVWRDELLLLAPFVWIFGLVSSQTGMNHHYRYVLPAMPFLCVWMSCAIEWWSRAVAMKSTLAVAITWAAVSSLWYCPHSLSYFNELAGGPLGGYRVLNNSNIDWGQDLYYLKAWLDEHPHVKAQDFRLAYFGNFNPALFEVYFRPPHPLYNHTRTLPIQEQRWLGPKPGWYAVSANYLTGHTMPMPEGNGQFKYYGQPAFTYFNEFTPNARAGYSIYIYRLELDDVNRVRRKLELPEL